MRFFFCYCVEEDYICKILLVQSLNCSAFLADKIKSLSYYFIIVQ